MGFAPRFKNLATRDEVAGVTLALSAIWMPNGGLPVVDGVVESGQGMLPVHDTSGILAALLAGTYTSDQSVLRTCISIDGTVTYTDVENRWIGQTIDADGVGTAAALQVTAFAYQGTQIALQYGGTVADDGGRPAEALQAADLAHRYLWGPAVDQILADEQVESLDEAGRVVWPLADPIGTVRDLVLLDAETGIAEIANHRVYDAFGNLQSQTDAAVDCLFGYTGRPFDTATGLQNQWNRWYDPQLRRWASEDPIGLAGGDGNSSGYLRSNPLDGRDPSGLAEENNGTPATSDPRDEMGFWEEVLFDLGLGTVTQDAQYSNYLRDARLLEGGYGAIKDGYDRDRYMALTLCQEDYEAWKTRQLGQPGFEGTITGISPVYTSEGEQLAAQWAEMSRKGAYGQLWLGSGGILETALHSFAGFSGAPGLLQRSKTTTPQVAARKAPNTPPANLTPQGAGRSGAFRQAKADAGIPRSQQPSAVRSVPDRTNPGRTVREYEFKVPGTKEPVVIREDRSGHTFGPNNPQNRGPHFNTPDGGHYDY